MGVFKSIHDTSEKAINSGEHYVHATQSYYKLKAFKYLTKSLSLSILTILIGSLTGIALIFLLVALTLWLSELLGNLILAFALISGLLFLISAGIFFFRKHIDRLIIKQVGDDYFNS